MESTETVHKQVKKKCAYYEDDYAREGVIPEGEFLPKVTFSFRPLTVIQAAEFTEQVSKAKNLQKVASIHMNMLQKLITKWDIEKPDGSIVDLQIWDELKKVDAFVMNRICEYIKEKAGNILSEEEVKNLQQGSDLS